jgi:putative endonuclease
MLMLESQQQASKAVRPKTGSGGARADSGRRTASSYSKGVDAESVAARTLERKGFRILDRRYRTAAGELDLVVADQTHLAFVEVKRRRSGADAVEAITARQQLRITGAAEIWLQEHPEYADRDMTFDAVLICPTASPQHIPDAFRPQI